MLNSVFDLWQHSDERCHKLEEQLAALSIEKNRTDDKNVLLSAN